MCPNACEDLQQGAFLNVENDVPLLIAQQSEGGKDRGKPTQIRSDQEHVRCLLGIAGSSGSLPKSLEDFRSDISEDGHRALHQIGGVCAGATIVAPEEDVPG